MEYRLFQGLLRSPLPRPIPLTLGISGQWLRRHGADVAWLLEQEAAGQWALTWMNHSDSHFYEPGRSRQSNFMLHPATDVEREILQLEWSLIQAGVTPSVFFRFPGLVADRSLVERVSDLGLIIVGCESWLAKGEALRNGAIVLVHGNGNEPWGVELFLKKLQRSDPPLILLPLSGIMA